MARRGRVGWGRGAVTARRERGWAEIRGGAMCGELGGGVGGELFGSLVLLALPACNVHDCFPLLSSCSSQTTIHHRPETCEKFEAFRLGRSSGIHFVQRSVVSPFVGCCIVRCVRSLDFAPPRAALFFLPPGPAVLRHGADDTLPPANCSRITGVACLRCSSHACGFTCPWAFGWHVCFINFRTLFVHKISHLCCSCTFCRTFVRACRPQRSPAGVGDLHGGTFRALHRHGGHRRGRHGRGAEGTSGSLARAAYHSGCRWILFAFPSWLGHGGDAP